MPEHLTIGNYKLGLMDSLDICYPLWSHYERIICKTCPVKTVWFVRLYVEQKGDSKYLIVRVTICIIDPVLSASAQLESQPDL